MLTELETGDKYMNMDYHPKFLQVIPVSQGIATLRGRVAVNGPQDFKKACQVVQEERMNDKVTCD